MGGAVIMTANGVRCRGALIRDICMVILTVFMVHIYFSYGVITLSAVRTFLCMYVCFVLVVLMADIYHRKYVLQKKLTAKIDRVNTIDIPDEGHPSLNNSIPNKCLKHNLKDSKQNIVRFDNMASDKETNILSNTVCASIITSSERDNREV